MTLGPKAPIYRQREVAAHCTCRNGLLVRVPCPACGVFLDYDAAGRMYREQSDVIPCSGQRPSVPLADRRGPSSWSLPSRTCCGTGANGTRSTSN